MDDYFPIDVMHRKSILPMTTTEEIWSLLVSKAILKFFHFKFKLLELNELNEENESTMTFLYNGDIINSLSGMFTLKYSLIE